MTSNNSLPADLAWVLTIYHPCSDKKNIISLNQTLAECLVDSQLPKDRAVDREIDLINQRAIWCGEEPIPIFRRPEKLSQWFRYHVQHPEWLLYTIQTCWWKHPTYTNREGSVVIDTTTVVMQVPDFTAYDRTVDFHILVFPEYPTLLAIISNTYFAQFRAGEILEDWPVYTQPEVTPGTEYGHMIFRIDDLGKAIESIVDAANHTDTWYKNPGNGMEAREWDVRKRRRPVIAV